MEAQINFENSTKVIFKNIHHQSIRKVLSSGMVATDELSAMSGVPRTFRMKKVYFNSFNSSNIICSLFTHTCDCRQQKTPPKHGCAKCRPKRILFPVKHAFRYSSVVVWHRAIIEDVIALCISHWILVQVLMV